MSRKKAPLLPPFSSPMPKVSVVLVTYHGAEAHLSRCLDCLRAQKYPDFETVIVDNASRPVTREAVQALVHGENLILNKRNLGFAGGCNRGIEEASGEIVVFLNYDTQMASDWLGQIVRPFLRNRAVAIVGCKIFYPGGRVLQHAGGIINANGMGEHVGFNEEDRGQYDQERDVDYVTGAALAARRDFLEGCGGFDTDFYPAYYEEVDLCYRAHRMGYRVLYTPDAELTHHESDMARNQSPVFRRLYYRGRMLFCLKNYGLRDWLFRFIPYEYRWLRAPWSKGLRRIQARAYLDALAWLLGNRHGPDRPFPL